MFSSRQAQPCAKPNNNAATQGWCDTAEHGQRWERILSCWVSQGSTQPTNYAQMPAHPSNVVCRQGDFRAAAHARTAQLRLAFKPECAIRLNLLTLRHPILNLRLDKKTKRSIKKALGELEQEQNRLWHRHVRPLTGQLGAIFNDYVRKDLGTLF